MNRDKIIKFCEEYLKAGDFQDGCINGLQVEGKPEVKKIITGVSFSKRLIEAAIEKKADMILAHHGIFRASLNEFHQIKSIAKARLKLLLENDISLAGFHLPLDAHPTIGNNASLCKLLGVSGLKPVDLGFYGNLKAPIDIKAFVRQVDNKLNTESFVMHNGSHKVRKVAIISGGAGGYYPAVITTGADTYITGELNEWEVREIEECGINIIAAGHYNTEKLGIQNLGNLLAKKFKIKVEFVDIPNAI